MKYRLLPLAHGQLVLRWTIEQPGITIALAGARNEKQVVENAWALTFNLSPEEMTFINQELSLLQLTKEKKAELVNINFSHLVMQNIALVVWHRVRMDPCMFPMITREPYTGFHIQADKKLIEVR